jgi:hypothetical protein
MIEAATHSPLTVTRWFSGLIVWAAHFLIVYASESLVCTRGGGAPMHATIVLTASIVAFVLLLGITAYSWRDASTARASSTAFMDRFAAALGLLGMLAVLWAALPAVFISACLAPA